MRNSLMPGLALATGLALTGCNTAPHSSSPDTVPQPMPAVTAAPSPSAPAEPCGDLDPSRLEVIVKDKAGTVTARHVGRICTAVYEPFSRERTGTLPVNSVFGALCYDQKSGGWLIAYGANYKNRGAVYLTQPAANADDTPGYTCDDMPHLPYAS